VVALGVKFGDQGSFAWLRERAASPSAPLAARRDALRALLAAKDPQLIATLHSLLTEPNLREAAIAGLANYEDAATPEAIITLYPELSPNEKRTALSTLSARATYALALLTAINDKRIPAVDLSADLVQQLHHLKDDKIDALVADVWGQVRTTPEDKARLIAEYRELVASPPAEPDVELGRAVFVRTCQQCHTLYGVGGKVGPDLTGSNRADLDYLLSNIVDPSAVIAREYQTTNVLTQGGRLISGVLGGEDEHAITLKTATETVLIPRDDVDTRELTPISMMPEDQLKQFTPHEVVSLLAYLRRAGQVPILARPDNKSLLFNGADLQGWNGSLDLWGVENGEIVGRSPGLQRNAFLVSDLAVEDFRLSMDVKLVDNVGNSGVQFRSEPLDDGEMRGYQADIGVDWWGKLYEEGGRALLWDKSGEAHVKPGEWNRYEIEARGSRIRTWLNDQLCVDLNDPAGARRGVIAVQLHSGGPTEVRFRNLQLEVLGAAEPAP
jgi:putative heme-binding domain-containing protein